MRYSPIVLLVLLTVLAGSLPAYASVAPRPDEHIPDHPDNVDIHASLRADPYAEVQPGQNLTIEVHVENYGEDDSSRIKVDLYYEDGQIAIQDARFEDEDDGWVSEHAYERLEITFNELDGETSAKAFIITKVSEDMPVGGMVQVWGAWQWRYREKHTWAEEIDRTVSGKTNIVSVAVVSTEDLSSDWTYGTTRQPPEGGPIYNRDQPRSEQRCFSESGGYCIGGRIREYWEQNGAEMIFGFPITPQREEWIEGVALQVQWFERYRLELHAYKPPPFDILVGRMGANLLDQQGRDWNHFPKSTPHPECRYFPETGHNVCGPILATWSAYGIELDGLPGKSDAESLALFGLPLSGLHMETLSDGQEYAVQWFERARFEMHPEQSPPHNLLLGLLGREIQQP